MVSTTLTKTDESASEAFDLDVRVEVVRVQPEMRGCNTDDGCGSTCNISACHSQR